MPTHISFNNSEDNSDSSVSKPNKAHTHTHPHEHPIGGNPPGYTRDPQNSPALSYNWDEERLNVPSKRDERSSSNKNNTTNRVYTHNNDSSNSYLDDYTSYTDDDPDDKQNPFSSTNDITRHNEDDTLAEDSELADGEYDSNEGPSRRVSNRLSKPFHQLGDRIHEGFETLTRSNTKMKRNRWGTQHNAKGRPKRSKSIFNRKHSIRQHSGNQGKMNDKPVKGPRTIYFNQVLPPSAVNPDTGFPMEDYPRNKIRTTKYTPLTFIPKNLFYQFRNVANIYFLLILILGVSIERWMDTRDIHAAQLVSAAQTMSLYSHRRNRHSHSTSNTNAVLPHFRCAVTGTGNATSNRDYRHHSRQRCD